MEYSTRTPNWTGAIVCAVFKQLVFASLTTVCLFMAVHDMNKGTVDDNERNNIQIILWVEFGIGCAGFVLAFGSSWTSFMPIADCVKADTFMRHIVFSIICLFHTYTGFNKHIDDAAYTVSGVTDPAANPVEISAITVQNKYLTTYVPVLVVVLAMDIIFTIRDGVWKDVEDLMRTSVNTSTKAFADVMFSNDPQRRVSASRV